VANSVEELTDPFIDEEWPHLRVKLFPKWTYIPYKKMNILDGQYCTSLS
jgi:hypothetical protein